MKPWPVILLLLIGGCAIGNLESDPERESGEYDLYSEPLRPQYHFSAPDEWIGDPNGLIYHDGQYHLFTWRHAVSEDMVYWEHLPRAFDDAWSGSVVVDEDNTSGLGSDDDPPWVAIYTLPDTQVQAQAINYSLDGGITWEVYEDNPVLNIGSPEFRDPQVFWYEPDERWIMVVALAEEQKVSIYASDNLIDWEHLSDFGPAGAVGGVWECPDLFPLPVAGDPENVKWVMQVDVQPFGGQYFIGDFDGTEFIADPEFAEVSDATESRPEGDIIEDFEATDYGSWETKGEAFGDGPVKSSLEGQTPVFGFVGERFVTSFHGGDEPTGTLLSPEFSIDRPYLNFKIGGGELPSEGRDDQGVGIRLLVDGDTVRESTGRNMENLIWKYWDVREFSGQAARIEIFDHESGGWGHVNADHIMLADEPVDTGAREPAFWVDYGMDFYATRSWRNTPNQDEYRKWVAWMSDWRYAHEVPTDPWTGVWTLPREVRLKTFDEGIRLVQQPVESLQKLRQEPVTITGKEVHDSLDLAEAIGFSGKEYEMILEIDPADADTAGIKVREGENEATVISYYVDEQVLSIDRRNSGQTDFSRSFPTISEAPLKLQDGKLKLHLFVDRSTLEVFSGDGRTSMSELIFPDSESSGLSLFSKGGTAKVENLTIYPMNSIW